MLNRTTAGRHVGALEWAISLVLAVLCQTAHAAPPVNDNFANGIVLSGDSGFDSNFGNVVLNWALQPTALTSQTISFAPLAPKPVLSAPFTVSATASSGLPVSFSSTTPGVCSVSGSTVTLLKSGVCTVAANQAGNASFAAAPAVAQSFTVASQIATGAYHTCALTSAGAVQCWGLNDYGQLGDSSTTNRLTPVAVSGPGGVGSFYVNGQPQTISFSSLAPKPVLSAPFTVSATASSGLPVSFSSTTPAVCSVSGSTVTLLSTGLCSISANQAGNTTYKAAPSVSRTFPVHSPLAVGGGYYGGHTCALTRVGAVHCWGNNYEGQLGDGTTTERWTPASVIGLPSAMVAVSAGMNHTCGLSDAGAVLCWGSNGSGSLGDNSTTARATPVQVSGLSSGVSAIATGFAHSCALSNAGTVQCWGNNWGGQLGDGSTTNRTVPVSVSGLPSGVLAITAGYYHTCALTDAGAVLCWGFNSVGQLGDNSTSNRLSPVAVSGLPSGVVAIEAGDHHTCALTVSGALHCWGSNSGGQLGDGSTANRLTPVLASGFSSGVKAFGAGAGHTCALTSAGAATCWGSNAYGQLGDNTTMTRLIPTAVSGLSSGVLAIAAGGYHSCALSSAGALQCWGSNVYGRLGDNSTTNRLTPVDVRGLGGVGNLNLTQQGSSTTLQAFPDSIAYGDTVALVATVTGNAPTGTVQFKDGGADLGPSVPLEDGVAVLVTSPLGRGSRSLTATYSGDAANAASVSAAVQLAVGKSRTSTGLSVSPTSPAAGSAVTLSASVSGFDSPTGQVEFFEGTTSLGTASLSGGAATLQTSALTTGPHTLTARYLGDVNNAGSDSAPVALTVAASGSGGSADDGDVPIPAWALVLLGSGLLAGAARKRPWRSA